MSQRQTVHELVDALSEEDLPTACRLLELVGQPSKIDDLEDILDSYALRQAREDQAGDDFETLEDFGSRLGLE